MTEILGVIGAWFACAVASERAAEVITTSKLFAPFRNWLAKVSLIPQKYVDTRIGHGQYILISAACRPFKFLSDLTSCGWCTSAWTSFVCAWFIPCMHRFFGSSIADNIIIQSLALFGFANLWHAVFRLVHRGRVVALDVSLIVDEAQPEASHGPEFNIPEHE